MEIIECDCANNTKQIEPGFERCLLCGSLFRENKEGLMEEVIPTNDMFSNNGIMDYSKFIFA